MRFLSLLWKQNKKVFCVVSGMVKEGNFGNDPKIAIDPKSCQQKLILVNRTRGYRVRWQKWRWSWSQNLLMRFARHRRWHYNCSVRNDVKPFVIAITINPIDNRASYQIKINLWPHHATQKIGREKKSLKTKHDWTWKLFLSSESEWREGEIVLVLFLCLGSEEFSKPTQMFSVSVLEIFLDT